MGFMPIGHALNPFDCANRLLSVHSRHRRSRLIRVHLTPLQSMKMALGCERKDMLRWRFIRWRNFSVALVHAKQACAVMQSLRASQGCVIHAV